MKAKAVTMRNPVSRPGQSLAHRLEGPGQRRGIFHRHGDTWSAACGVGRRRCSAGAVPAERVAAATAVHTWKFGTAPGRRVEFPGSSDMRPE